jgi:hypothetical protein
VRGREYLIPLAAACCIALTAGLAQGQDSRARAEAAGWQVSCGSDPFLPTAFNNPTGAENEQHPSAAALRRFLKGPYIGYEFPEIDEIRLLTRTETLAQYAGGEPTRKGIPVVSFEPREDGSKWELAGLSSSCRPRSVQEGFHVGEWRLARRAATEVAPGADAISVLVRENACASGSNPKRRMAEPLISYGPRRIVVVVRIRPLKGEFQTCPLNPWIRYRIRLDEPIGARTVVDGGSFPYAPRVNPR